MVPAWRMVIMMLIIRMAAIAPAIPATGENAPRGREQRDDG
jgi:hypothetical protein